MKGLYMILLGAVSFTVTAMGQTTNTFPTTGNVGIGTLTPQAWFSGNVLELKDNRPILRLSPTSDGGLGTILFKGAYNETPGTLDEFHLNYVSSLTNPRIVLTSYQGAGGEGIFSILGNGNIGVGVETPKDKLSVKGNIRAYEIKVETANWPDYVFAKDYKLPTLQETEKHIKDKGHLPGIPSASEVETNGVDLGEMNAKLLQKIEELTLHLIEMKKQNDEQKLNNQIQQKQIKAQQQDIEYLKSKLK